jgi:arabinofuranosyltransferase
MAYLCAALAIVVFFKNFWITEDTFIGFRVLEQVQAGRGPVWNAGIRTQIFTCVGWFLTLAFTNFFTHNVFAALVISNTIAFTLFLFLARKIFFKHTSFCLFLLIILLSKSFFDYTSSGLDNIFGFLFITFLYYQYKTHNEFTKNDLSKSDFFFITFLTATITLARQDLILISFPPFIYLVYKYLPKPSLLLKAGLVAWMPMLIWTIFSLIYYGKALPNTAYVKLFHGYPESFALASGINYFLQHVIFDPYTLIAIFLSFIGSLLFLEPWKKFFAIGMLTHFIYVIYIGGEYMLGRFLSYSFLVAALLLTEIFQTLLSSKNEYAKKLNIFIFSLILIGLVTPSNPLVTPWAYGRNLPWSVTQDADIQTRGVVDMRKAYYSTSSAAWYYNETHAPSSRESSDVRLGVDLKKHGDKIAVIGATGATGYYAGTDILLLDYFGLTDPFVAMLPAIKLDFTSHFERELPKGYFESFLDEKNKLDDPKLDEYYRHIKFITTSKDLFTLERLIAIYKLNTGQYDYLLEDYRKEVERKRDLTIPVYTVWGTDIERVLFKKLGLTPR